MSAEVLALPRKEGMFVLDTDASNVAVGGVLSQRQNGTLRPIAFASKRLIAAQRKYCTTRKELLAVVTFTRQFRHYLLGRRFLIRTDHSSPAWLMRFKDIEGQLTRWLKNWRSMTCRSYTGRGKSMVMPTPCRDFPTPGTAVTVIKQELRWTRFLVEDVHIALGRTHSGGGSRRMWTMSCHWP